jgi:hypothetical protein
MHAQPITPQIESDQVGRYVWRGPGLEHFSWILYGCDKRPPGIQGAAKTDHQIPLICRELKGLDIETALAFHIGDGCCLGQQGMSWP